MPHAKAREDAEHQSKQKKMFHLVANTLLSFLCRMFYQSWILQKVMIGLMIGIWIS